MAATGHASLLDLPNEVLLEQLLPSLSAEDIAAVSRVNKAFNALANEETLWLRLTLLHYSFHPSLLAPPTQHSGWSKRVYLGLRSPEAVVWGSSDNGRLGVDISAQEGGIRRFRRHVDHPITVPLRAPSSIGGTGPMTLVSGDPSNSTGVRIVDLQASGFGFTARDSNGGVWVWGQLDGSIAGHLARGWANPSAPVTRPTRLPLPCHAEDICAGRRHLLVLDSDNLLWEMRSWGLVYYHTSPALTAPTNSGSKAGSKHIKQISAGWSHSAYLTAKGDIYVTYPFTAAYGESLTPESELAWTDSGDHDPLDNDGQSRQRWGKIGDVVHPLDPIPPRPAFEATGARGEEAREARLAKLEMAWKEADERTTARERDDGETIIRIASGIDFVVALRANGEVWLHRLKDGENHDWSFLPHLSGPGMTHLTAQYLSITSYSSTSIRHVRLPPSMNEIESILPTPVPALEGKRIIQVVSGDYHDVALTEGGEVWTWGQGDHGQLGTGKTIRMQEEPERVRFPGETEGDEKTRRFAFGITAAGWHTGALLLGDDPEHPVPRATATTSSAQTPQDRGDERPDPWDEPGPGGPGERVDRPFATSLGPPMFRVGFAGRGSAIGNVARRNWQRRQATEDQNYPAGSGSGNETENQDQGQEDSQ